MSRRILIEFVGQDRGLSSSINDADNRTSKLGSTLKTVGKAAAVGLAAGAVVAGKALYDMTQGAIEDQAAQVKLATTLRNTANATDSQIAQTEEWIAAQGRALGVTDDELRPALQRMAEATGDVEKAQKLVSVAMDVSAGTGRSLKSVTEAMLRAQNGSVSGLSRYGIATEKANGETMSFNEVVKSMSKTFEGQAAKSADTMQGKMARLRLIWDETKETIGAKLIPILTRLADWFLADGLPALERFGRMLGTVGEWFGHLGGVVRQVFGGLPGEVGGPLEEIRGIIREVVSIVLSLWRRFGGILTDYWRETWKNARTILGGAFKIIRGLFKVFAALLRGDWKGVWDGVKLILRGALEVIVGVVRQALNLLKAVMRVGWSAIKGIVGSVWDGIKSLVDAGADRVVDFVRSIPDRLRSLAGRFGDAGRFIINGFVNGLKNAAGVIGGIVGNVWSALRGLINGAIDRINSALEFTIRIPGPDIHINPPNIGHLARGTRSWRGGLTIVGEEGPELVNLPRGSRVWSAGETAAMAGGGFLPVVIQMDGKAVWQGLLEVRRNVRAPLGLG